MACNFYLGTHEPSWLGRTQVPLFVSRRRLGRYGKWPVAAGSWSLDSGGFSELSLYGAWQTSLRKYVLEVDRANDEIGGLQWAAQQDWMCEPFIIQKTGLSIPIHQRNTVENYLELMSVAPALPWVPVLQGFELNDYLQHDDMFRSAGVHLSRLPLVGIGSVCRRQHTIETATIIRRVAALGIRLHGFGLKEQALRRVANIVVSADSMAWSFTARRQKIHLPGHKHQTCQNCLPYALLWRKQLLERISHDPTGNEAAPPCDFRTMETQSSSAR